ncbi:MAG TPA: hypothetical protein VMX94_05295 [Armatimonadota bacterium]|nr:hypothetical protein [Armatimonadota bacterium]
MPVSNIRSLIRTVESFPDGHQDAYLGNGVIGLRVRPDPFASWKAIASGFVKEHEEGRFEALANAPYAFGMDFKLGDTPSMLENAGRARVRKQSLDMSCGELTTELEFPLGGGMARAQVLQFVSRTCPVAACQEVRLTAPQSGDLKVTMSVLPGPDNEIYAGAAPGGERWTDLTLGCTANGRISKCGLSVKADFGGAEVSREDSEKDKPQTSRAFRLKVEAGRQIAIRSIAATVTSAYHPEPELESCRLANWAASIGFDSLRSQNRAAWREIWKSRVLVTGDEKAQDYLDCALFYLYSSAHPSCRTSVPPFGMSQADYYHGHVFWDTDIFMTPVLLLTSPETARMTIAYRLRTLEAAKKRAECYGYKGAMYPWESDTRGFESTPSDSKTGWLEQHVNMCVAFAAWQYQKAAGDKAWAGECTWPILKAVAEWIESRVEKTKRGCEIWNVMSTDESRAVNNSSYVNALSAQVLRNACECAKLVGQPPMEKWREIAESMFIPIGPAPQQSGVRGDIIYKHDGGWEKDCSTDLFIIGFPLDLPFDRSLLRNTYDAHMTLRKESFSMGYSFVVGEAAFVGDRNGARESFHRLAEEVFEPTWGMGTECPGAATTCFLTTMAGVLQAAMMAFTGIRFEPGNWAKYEACLPDGWKRIEIERIYLGGQAYSLEAEHGRKARLAPIE